MRSLKFESYIGANVQTEKSIVVETQHSVTPTQYIILLTKKFHFRGKMKLETLKVANDILK